jgi:hypothetical protein
MNMKLVSRILIAGIAALAGTAGAQTVVTGTGKPDIDIPAVQAAVDGGGSVELRGHFSFDNPPAKRGEMPYLIATVLVSKPVTISGAWDAHGEITTIEGGEIPFAVEAAGAVVKIEKLRFIHPKLFTIFVDAAAGLTIDSCIIENVQPRPLPGNLAGLTSGLGIYVSTVMGLPVPGRLGNPSNVSGKLSIRDNRISGVGAADHGMGIMIVNVGDRENPVEVEISGNNIRDSSLKGINVTQIGGHARIERNIVMAVVVPEGHVGGRTSGIHCGGAGSYVVDRNVIDVADPQAAGIRIRGYPALGAAIERATISNNEVTMSAAEGAQFGTGNAGIEILGLARGIVVQGNRIRGRARVGIAVTPDNAGSPVGTTLDRNDRQHLITPMAGGGAQK